MRAVNHAPNEMSMRGCRRRGEGGTGRVGVRLSKNYGCSFGLTHLLTLVHVHFLLKVVSVEVLRVWGRNSDIVFLTSEMEVKILSYVNRPQHTA